MSMSNIVPLATGGVIRAEPATRRNDWLDLMTPAAELANQIADTEFVPAEFRRNPAAIAACVLYGAEIGIGPMQSLAKIDIVKGRPAPRAELGRALALAAGHELWVEERTNTRVVMCGRRRGSNHVDKVTWTMDDAKKAGIAGNPSYAKYPRQMLLARASAELVRTMCPDVLGGITVFAEEAVDLADDAAPESRAVDSPTASATESGTRKRRRPASDDKPTEPPAADAPAGDDKPSSAQTKKAMALFTETGLGDRSDRLGVTGAMVGRTVDSWSTLTRAEADRVIDQLEQLETGVLTLDVGAEGAWKVTRVDTAESDLPLLPDEAQ